MSDPHRHSWYTGALDPANDPEVTICMTCGAYRDPRTETGRWLADWMVEDGAIDRLPEGWDDPHALIAKIEAEGSR